MNTIKNNVATTSPFFRNACIAMIWLIIIYASIIQYVVIEISHAMLILGVIILLLYCLTNSGEPYVFHEKLTKESIYMLFFMVYMATVGTLVSIDRSGHLTQALTSLQYLFILVVISSLIKVSGTESFQQVLLVQAIILAAFFLKNPVEWEAERYSISKDVNPNGLGMEFATGIWAVLYRQQKRKLPIAVAAGIITILGYCIVQTGSRKSLLAAGLTIVLWLFFCFIPDIMAKGGYKGLITFIIMVILIVAIGYIFIGLYSGSTLANRMERLTYEAQEGSRSKMYRAGIEIFKFSPLFGVGFQGFKYSYGLYSHATIVEVPVSGGIFGALLYFSVYFLSLKKTILLLLKTRGVSNFASEHSRLKMILVLWAVMLFYTTCIIHPYQFDSYVLFGIIFGETAFIECKLSDIKEEKVARKLESKYLKT